MRICLTNDDGYEAFGLSVLARVAGEFGATDIVAPSNAHSQLGHGVTLNRSIAVRRLRTEGLGRVRAVEGTPADCVRVALWGPTRTRPDWVLSGINHGANLGVDVYYSGTVAAAREGAIHGIPSIALSQLIRRPQSANWDGAAIMARRVLARLLSQPCPHGVFWSVTFPAVTDEFDTVPIVEAPLCTDPLPLVFAEDPASSRQLSPQPAGQQLQYAGRYMDRPYSQGSDVDVAFSGRIVVTRLRIGAG